MSIHDLLDRMESAEDAFLKTEFLAPVLPGGRVRVRIEGLVCTLRVTGRASPGWAILKPLSMDRARVVAPGPGGAAGTTAVMRSNERFGNAASGSNKSPSSHATSAPRRTPLSRATSSAARDESTANT